MAYNLGNKCAKNWTIDNSTLCLKKTCDHIFDDTLNYVYKDFWHTYYQEYTQVQAIDRYFSFPPHLFSAAT